MQIKSEKKKRERNLRGCAPPRSYLYYMRLLSGLFRKLDLDGKLLLAEATFTIDVVYR